MSMSKSRRRRGAHVIWARVGIAPGSAATIVIGYTWRSALWNRSAVANSIL
jgi:hypothetical protein